MSGLVARLYAFREDVGPFAWLQWLIAAAVLVLVLVAIAGELFG
jgi:hypothetical protein